MTVHRSSVPVSIELPGRTTAYLVAQVRARVDGIVLKREFKERVVAAEQRSLDLSEALFKNGVASYLAVLTAQNGLYGAQLTLVSTRLARLTNLVDLYRTLGGGWIERTGDAPRPPDVAANTTPRTAGALAGRSGTTGGTPM